MRQFLQTSLLLFFVSTILSCGSSSQGEEQTIESLKSEVLDIHDEVMPKMGELRTASKSLMELSATSPDSLELRALASDIKAANDRMMDWMRNYEPEFEGTDEEYFKYLEDQKIKIQKVKDDMLKSLEKGKQKLNQ